MGKFFKKGERRITIKGFCVRYADITEAGKDVHELVKINYHLLFDIPLPYEEEEEEEPKIEYDEAGNPITGKSILLGLKKIKNEQNYK